ncbi:MAG: phosphoribosylglycinamide formyltransferase [Desulfobacterales bacterium]|jgi:phosphoribosylglycinamide formyltransferase-1|nr:phosphoribosylglycinamide formyltransferase [Desulfobacterales bacterium]
MAKKIRIGALISGGGTNLQAIIDACESGRIDGEMVFVGSDNPNAKGLERSRKHHIPNFVVDYGAIIRGFKNFPDSGMLQADFSMAEVMSKQSLFPPNTPRETVELFLATRAIAEAQLLRAMDEHPFDLLVLAGFMRNLTPYFIDRVNGDGKLPRIMNIHPALLPSFPGVDGYGDTYHYGCKVGGCTVHFIDYGEDSGPIIGQRSFSIEPEDTLDRVKEKGLKEEWKLYPECIRLYAENRLQIVKQTRLLPGGQQTTRRVVQILTA